ncbi:RagB/SusD family nutrient uptake outer membrane protein [Pedobacter jeongneungensis]|uniref:RagB/SusD family nutrient uptake outer membrane protein n=1 Tax=Pedobacter jeongneungensis TaxID=947309 RepID=UPI0004683CB3|nr:RagB/SusD family nutrient uptake outer membrane protein [Pedobacter jeongneungensis]
MNTISKKILMITALAMSMGFWGCKKALEEKSFTFVSPNNFYQNETDAKAAINGVYNELYTYDLFIQPFWNLTLLDDDHVSGADWYLGNAGAGNPQSYWGVSRPWAGCYTMISRANAVLENVANISSMNATVRDRILGEAYFLRGWAYFQLVQLYGGVPVRLKSLSQDKSTNVPRSSVKEVYDVVISDFKNAESKLLPSTDANVGELGRVTKAVASSFLAKTYLTMASGALSAANIKVRGGNDNSYYTYSKTVVAGYESFDSPAYFKLARDKAQEVISSYGASYALFTNWKDVFAKGNRNKQEQMWELQSLAGTDFQNDLHSYFSAGSLFGIGAVWMSNHHYDNYELSDTRVLDGVTHRYKANWGTYYYYPSAQSSLYGGTAPDGTVYNNDGAADNKAYINKYSDVSDPTLGKSDAFYPLLRYSEVLLIFAEAENEINPGSSTAYTQLNAVRTRAKASSAPIGMGREDFRSFVLEERGREFALENSIRHFDLLRWGIYLGVMNRITVQQNNINKQRTQRNLLLPIPQDEMNTNKAITANNPGW